MLNTEKEKINILSLYNIKVLDDGGNTYKIEYDNLSFTIDRFRNFYYDKNKFKHLNTFGVVSYILRVFGLNGDMLLKEKYLIDNNFTKSWLNSKFTIAKDKVLIQYKYMSYRDDKYEDFVKNISDRYESGKKSKTYDIIDDVIKTYNYKGDNKTYDINTILELKSRKEHIKKILSDKNMIM